MLLDETRDVLSRLWITGEQMNKMTAEESKYKVYSPNRKPCDRQSQIPSQKGFTLIELMIVVVIIGILASLAIPRFMSATTRQKQNECKMILKQIYVNQRAYRQENTTYWGNGISADSINTGNFAPLTVEIQTTAKYTYSLTASATSFLATATATGLDDDPANDVWTMNQDGILTKVSDDSQS